LVISRASGAEAGAWGGKRASKKESTETLGTIYGECSEDSKHQQGEEEVEGNNPRRKELSGGAEWGGDGTESKEDLWGTQLRRRAEEAVRRKAVGKG